MGLLRLNVLGPPEVFHDGSRLTFALRKAQALLLYLAVEGGMHQRRKLDAFLWPDSEPHEARAALRNAIALLRRLLGDPETSPSQHTHLLNLHDLLSLDPHAPVELDLDVVLHAWKEAHKLSMVPSEEQHAALVTLVQRALALVRGPFLDGFWYSARPKSFMTAAASPLPCAKRRPCCSTWRSRGACIKGASWTRSCGPTVSLTKLAPPCVTLLRCCVACSAIQRPLLPSIPIC